MSESSAPTDAFEFPCPHCQATVSARWDQLSEALECPVCHQPFEPPAPPSPITRPRGRYFQFQCLRCGSVLEARTSQTGRKGKCPTCAALFIVPQVDPHTGLARTNADPGEDGENPTPVHAYAAAGDMAPRIHRKDDDRLVIECPRCHGESGVDADTCSKCGLPFTLEGMTGPSATPGSRLGTAALTLGIVAVPLSLCGGVGIVPGVIAIALGLWGISNQKVRGFSMAHTGVALGFCAVLVGGIVFWAGGWW